MTRVTLTFRPEEEVEIPTRTELEDLRRQGVIHSFVDPDPREAETVENTEAAPEGDPRPPQGGAMTEENGTSGDALVGPSPVVEPGEKSGKPEKKKGGDPE